MESGIKWVFLNQLSAISKCLQCYEKVDALLLSKLCGVQICFKSVCLAHHDTHDSHDSHDCHSPSLSLPKPKRSKHVSNILNSLLASN